MTTMISELYEALVDAGATLTGVAAIIVKIFFVA